LLVAAPGCTRNFFRQRADKDVAGVITQKNVFPDWRVLNWHVYPDPRARFADPSCPDRPPYPPDDYAARILSPNPQHPTKKVGAGRFEGTGYLASLSRWDAENRALDAAEDAAEAKKNLPPPPAAEKIPAPKPVPPAAPGASRAQPGIPGLSRGTETARLIPPVGPPEKAAAGRAPSVTESRDGGVIVAAGEIPDGDGKMIPAVMMIPTAQPPGKLPDAVVPEPTDPAAPPKPADPGPFPAGPGVPPGGPAVPGATGPYAVVATGAAASEYLKALATNETGYRIRMEQAVEFGLFNSREFQDRREDLYLAALPVTLERFNFAALGFFTETAALDFAGRLSGRTPRNAATFNTETGFSKLFPTGALLLVRVANQVVVDLTGDRPTTTLSNLSLSLAQPFLRGGGYAVTLEPLTGAERNMLYAIRSYARFRKLFYVAITAGGNITNNPYSFQGLSVNLGRGIGGNLTAPSVGYLDLLQQSAVIANQRRNIESLEQLLALYRAFREGGQQSDLQVSQVEQQLLRSQTDLLGSSNANTGGGGGGGGSGIRGYLDTLDNFKLQLGLPLTVGLDLEGTPLRPIRDQLARFDAVYAQVREMEALARRFDPAAPVADFRPRWRRLLTEPALVRGTGFARDITNRWAGWERLSGDAATTRLTELADERRRVLDRQADRQLKGQPEPAAETRRLNELNAEIDLGVFERAVRVYEAQPWAKEQGVLRATVQAAAFRDVFNAFYQLILEGRNERLAQIRRQWPKLPAAVVEGADLLDVPLDDAYTAGIQTALTHRLDLMNARGQVVDAWRQIKVQANSLQGVLDVQYNLDSSTPPGGANPVAFSGARTDHNLTFRGELPLVRRAERNNYRAALIGYQRQRRTLMAFEDNIANDVRADIREIRTIAELYRVQQRLVELGYSQVDNAQQVLLQPPAPGAQNDAGSQAALTNQVLQAQSSLVSAQNTLYTIWVNYLTSRMTLYLDLELMQIDERGGWCNESLPGSESPDGPPPPEPAPAGGERLPPPRPAEPGRGR
jgi:hypothetical protein